MTVAGKTGTTTSDFDRWFAGYTPYYTGVVWCGYDDPEEVVLTDSSTNPAIVLWQKVMEQVHDGLPNKEFNKPTNVVRVYGLPRQRPSHDRCVPRGPERKPRCDRGAQSLRCADAELRCP